MCIAYFFSVAATGLTSRGWIVRYFRIICIAGQTHGHYAFVVMNLWTSSDKSIPKHANDANVTNPGVCHTIPIPTVIACASMVNPTITAVLIAYVLSARMGITNAVHRPEPVTLKRYNHLGLWPMASVTLANSQKT